jgi:enoyl-CoA hydratase/carnithine racemase
MGSQSMPWDVYIDYQGMSHFTECFMSLWRSLKPVICKVNGPCIAGGSDIALCCDLIVMAEEGKSTIELIVAKNLKNVLCDQYKYNYTSRTS